MFASPDQGRSIRWTGVTLGVLFWALLALAGFTASLGIEEFLVQKAYLSPINRSILLLLWALAVGLAAAQLSGKQGLGCLLLVGLTAVGAHGAAWLGLFTRNAVGDQWADLAFFVYPALAACGLTTIALALLRYFQIRIDPILAGVPLILFSLGLTLLRRIGVEYEGMGRQEVVSLLAERQLLWFALGLGAMVICARLATPRRLSRLIRRRYLLPLVAAALILITWQFGPEINQRRLWLTLGPLNFQTVELIKILMVLFAAGYFSADYRRIMGGAFSAGGGRLWEVMGPYAMMLGLPVLALIVQRDFGPAVLFLCFFNFMAFVATGSWLLPVISLLLGLGLGFVGYETETPLTLFTRISAWLDPFATSEQLTRGLWGIAAGGAWGVGWGGGRPHTIPLSYSDFAFGAICEELGLVGALAVIALVGLLIWRGALLVRSANNPQSAFLGLGLVAMLVIQALLVMGGVSGLIPLAGLTFPFVSLGGSSLVSNMAMVGILMRVADDTDDTPA